MVRTGPPNGCLSPMNLRDNEDPETRHHHQGRPASIHFLSRHASVSFHGEILSVKPQTLKPWPTYFAFRLFPLPLGAL